MLKTLFTSLFITLGLSVAALGGSPEETAEAYITALDKNDYETVAKLMSTDSLVEFRGYFDGLMNLDADEAEQRMQMYFGDDVTPENIILLSDEDFFLKFLQTTIDRFQKALPSKLMEQTTVGTIKEGEKQVHVVSRIKTNNGDLQKFIEETMEVNTVTKQGDNWKMTLCGDMKINSEFIGRVIDNLME